MPNHIRNRLILHASPEKVEQIVSAYGTFYEAKPHLDFDNNIIFQEEGQEYSYGWLDLKTGGFKRRGLPDVVGVPDGYKIEIVQPYTLFPDFNKIKPQPANIFNEDLSQEDEDRCRREGRPTWKDWNRENWGTKWNSYSCMKESWNTYVFETAWNGVPDIIRLLSQLLPDVKITYQYSDEDTGYNCGVYEFLNGELLFGFNPEGGSITAYDIAFMLRPGKKKNYQLVNGKYEWVNDDED